jgi:hypothetical protein
VCIYSRFEGRAVCGTVEWHVCASVSVSSEAARHIFIKQRCVQVKNAAFSCALVKEGAVVNIR